MGAGERPITHALGLSSRTWHLAPSTHSTTCPLHYLPTSLPGPWLMGTSGPVRTGEREAKGCGELGCLFSQLSPRNLGAFSASCHLHLIINTMLSKYKRSL